MNEGKEEGTSGKKKQFGFFAKICRPDFWILLLSLILSGDVVDQRKNSL